jgi:hypothetical protein
MQEVAVVGCWAEGVMGVDAHGQPSDFEAWGRERRGRISGAVTVVLGRMPGAVAMTFAGACCSGGGAWMSRQH